MLLSEILLSVVLVIVLWIAVKASTNNYYLRKRIIFLQNQNEILSRTVSKQSNKIQELKFGKADVLDAEIIEF